MVICRNLDLINQSPLFRVSTGNEWNPFEEWIIQMGLVLSEVLFQAGFLRTVLDLNQECSEHDWGIFWAQMGMELSRFGDDLSQDWYRTRAETGPDQDLAGTDGDYLDAVGAPWTKASSKLGNCPPLAQEWTTNNYPTKRLLFWEKACLFTMLSTGTLLVKRCREKQFINNPQCANGLSQQPRRQQYGHRTKTGE